MLPKKKKRSPMGVRQSEVIRCAGHLAWVRRHECVIRNHECDLKVEACHVRSSGEGGVGMKPGDNWTLPLCSEHHRCQHLLGESEFEAHYGFDMKAVARAMWQNSPHRLKYERKLEQSAQSVAPARTTP